ncbi:DUF1365 domain-containing protein [uncultured Caulobacter sp.]|uniref:DUF1365 domain-containing protein n=1 Tax=uncultured Caulobacter sp. TaxID=158749 RepID=UPI00260F400B|nr:DUF1365 domain-containing protein [uncultured Caulobacter sp.]
MTLRSALYAGHVVHDRARPKRHRLRYRVFMLLLDLDEVDVLDRRLKRFSRDRWNLVGFSERDHLDAPATSLKDEVLAKLRAGGLAPDGARISVLAMPRILGKGFNPLSVFFCHDAEGRLVATVHAVRNTFGQRHDYVLPAGPPRGGVVEQRAGKVFYVSPFMPMDLRYAFAIVPPGETVQIGVDVLDEDGLLMTATFAGERRALTDAALWKALAGHPWQVAGVLAAIHWEAVKLVLKGFRFFPQDPATRGLKRPAETRPPTRPDPAALAGS